MDKIFLCVKAVDVGYDPIRAFPTREKAEAFLSRQNNIVMNLAREYGIAMKALRAINPWSDQAFMQKYSEMSTKEREVDKEFNRRFDEYDTCLHAYQERFKEYVIGMVDDIIEVEYDK